LGATRAIRGIVLIAFAFVLIGSGSGTEARRAFLYRALDFGGLSNSMAVAMQQDLYPVSRELAARALASNADPKRMRLLREYSRDLNPRARYQAMIAAGRIGPKAFGVARAGLGDAAALVRQSAVWAATHCGDEAFDSVIRVLLEDTDPTVLQVALGNSWRFGEKPWEAAVSRFASHADPVLRRAAAYSLARSERSARSPALESLVRDPEPVIRATALAGLRRGPLSAGSVRLVFIALDDPDWRVQAAACEVIASRAELELPDASVAKLQSLLTHRRAQLAVPALRSAAAHPNIGTELELRRIAEEGEPWPAAEALLALAGRGSEGAIELADAWLDTDQSWRRKAVARMVSAVSDEVAAKLEKRVLADRDATVRLARLESMAAGEAAQRAGVLWDLLNKDPDVMVRAQAIQLLRDAGAVDDPARMLQFAGEWSADELPDARAAALSAALALEEDDRRPRVLEIAFGDRDRAVAALVAVEARKLGLEASVPTGDPRHGERWYRDLVDWTASQRWLDVVTLRGTFRIRLELGDAPITAREVWDLARDGFYDGLSFHRVVSNFVVQGGDPRGDGWGGPGFVLPDEPSLRPFDVWRVGIATSGPHTGGCQLFVTLLPADRLTGHYTNFGEVVAGREVLTRLQVGDRIVRVVATTGAEPPPPVPVLLDRLEWSQLAELDGWEDELVAYEPEPEFVDRLTNLSGRFRIYTVLGTWCEDSLRELPRLQRVLEEIGDEGFEHVMVGVDRSKRVFDDLVPAHLLTGAAVESVPTIVVTDEADQELGRVVETAQRPIEELLVEFLVAAGGLE
jgi:cyclophilin family peptidyl-prolyl cis-trans isomerase